jgi:hypothetical protein
MIIAAPRMNADQWNPDHPPALEAPIMKIPLFQNPITLNVEETR